MVRKPPVEQTQSTDHRVSCALTSARVSRQRIGSLCSTRDLQSSPPQSSSAELTDDNHVEVRHGTIRIMPSALNDSLHLFQGHPCSRVRHTGLCGRG